MLDFYSDELQYQYGQYLAWEQALNQLGDNPVPKSEVDEFILSLHREPLTESQFQVVTDERFNRTFVGRKAFLAFAGIWLDRKKTKRLLHTYSHTSSSALTLTNSETAYVGERQLTYAVLDTESVTHIAPEDLVLVEVKSFDGDMEALKRILELLTDTGAGVFVDMFSSPDYIPSDSLERWFHDRRYVPVKREVLEGFYRPILATGPGGFG